MKDKIRFMSLQLGFQLKAVPMPTCKNKQIVVYRCCVGCSTWRKKLDIKQQSGIVDDKRKEMIDQAKYCPFILYYIRDINDDTGMPYTPYRLLRYNMVHSHPL